MDAKIPRVPSPKVRNFKPRSSTAAVRRSTRLAMTTRESTAVLERRVTRSMTKQVNNNKTEDINQNTSKDKSENKNKNNTKAAAATRRSSKRRRVGWMQTSICLRGSCISCASQGQAVAVAHAEGLCIWSPCASHGLECRILKHWHFKERDGKIEREYSSTVS